MLNFFRDGLHYIHLTFFKTMVLNAETINLSKKEETIILLRTYMVACIFAMLLLAILGAGYGIMGYPFDWHLAYQKLLAGLSLALSGGVIAKSILGLSGGLIASLVLLLILGVLVSISFAVTGNGLILGLVGGLVAGLMGGLMWALILEVGNRLLVIVGLLGGLVGGGLLGADKGILGMAYYFLWFFLSYMIMCFRPFYILPHMLQYWRSSIDRDSFMAFRNSPVYWDQMIHMPLPFLQDWLVKLIKCDHQQGMIELFFVIRDRPFQRKAAFNALLIIMNEEWQHIQSVCNLNANGRYI